MAMTPRDELADELLKRLHNPGAYVERGKTGEKQEPLKMWQLRAIMDYFEDVQKRIVPGNKVVIAGRGAFRDRDPNLDDN